ncbi:hypothetical protein H4684_002860, partial [Desulfomicrobium macestii]
SAALARPDPVRDRTEVPSKKDMDPLLQGDDGTLQRFLFPASRHFQQPGYLKFPANPVRDHHEMPSKKDVDPLLQGDDGTLQRFLFPASRHFHFQHPGQ